MSFLAKQPALPQSTPAESQQQSTYREADPIGLGYGREVWGSHWISRDFNWRTAYGGQNRSEWQYASIAAAYRVGPIDFLGKVYRDGKVIADFDYTFAPGEDSHEFIINPSLALGEAWKLTLYRGTETQLPNALLAAGTGLVWPALRGLCWGLWENIDLGQGSTTIPSLSLELGKHAPAIGAFAGGDSHPYGVNPFAAIYGFATEQKGGLGDDGTLFQAAHWGAQANALEAIGIGQRSGAQVHCHPMLAQSQDASAFFSNILTYVDGFLFVEGDEIKVGWFPHAAPGGSLPEITEHDLEGKPSGNGFGDTNAGPSEVVVIFKDWLRRYTESPASAPAPANLETGLIPTPVRRDRPFLHDAEQAAIVAAELAAETASDDSITLNVLRSRAVDGTGAPLMPGDLVDWDYGPHARDLVCRVVSRRMRPGSASDVLTLIRERGQYPRPYVPPVDARVLPVDDEPGEISVGDVRLWLAPLDMTGGVRKVVALINRAKRTIYRADLHLSPTGSAPWEVVLDSRFFTAKCAVTAGGISSGAATVRVISTSVDFARMAAQSTVAQTDDTLLLLIGDEVLSVGAVTVVATNTYDLAILRGRRSTAAAAHADGAVAWLFYRAELQAAEHAEFYRVRNGSNVYDAGIATKRFKIALFTIYADGLPKPDDPGLSLQLPDVTDAEAAEAAGYTIVLSSEAHTVATATDGTPNAGQLGAGSLAKTTVQVFRGGTALTAVASSPGADQFAVTLGTHSNATATKETDTTVRCDSLSADTGVVALVVNVAGLFNVAKSFTLTKAKAGAGGGAGSPGIPGPGLVYAGPYNSGTIYYHTTTRRDVVSHGGSFYVTNNAAKSGTATWGTPGGADWSAPDASYKFVATDLLLANDVNILRTLVMGDGVTSNAGLIRSAGATAFGTGTGFWLGYDGTTPKWRIGDPAGKHIGWDGSVLTARFGSGSQQTYISDTTFLFGNPSGSKFFLHLLGSYVEAGVVGSGDFLFGNDASGGMFSVKSAGGPSMLRFDCNATKLVFTNDPNAAWYRSGSGVLKSDGSIEAGQAFVTQGGRLELNGAGRQQLSSSSGRSISFAPQGSEAWLVGSDTHLKTFGGDIRKVTNDGRTPKLYDGSNSVEFSWDGGLELYIDGSFVGNVQLA